MAKRSQIQHYNEAVEKQMGYVACVRTGNTLRLAGVIAVDLEMNIIGLDDMTAQINQIYDIIGKTLSKSDADMSNVVNEVIYVRDLSLLMEPAATEARIARYAECAPPAATAVQVSGLASPDALIEIQVTAVLD